MKTQLPRLGLRAALVAICIFSTGLAPSQETRSTDELAILFIGNSLTHYNDLPKMLVELAKAGKQRPVRFEQETPGGCTLEKHWRDGKALKKIQSRKWDYVVLQDHSTATFQLKNSMVDHAKKFDEAIRKQGSKTLLYMTWALQNKPSDQQAITKAYTDLAKELRAEVVPVGLAWETALKADPAPKLHQNDKKHPTPAGTYLAACVFYANIFDTSPEGLPGSIGKMSDEDARPLQSIAWKSRNRVE